MSAVEKASFPSSRCATGQWLDTRRMSCSCVVPIDQVWVAQRKSEQMSADALRSGRVFGSAL